MTKIVFFVGYVQSEYLNYFVDSGYVIGYLYDQDDPYKIDDPVFRNKIHILVPVNFNSNQAIIGSLSEVLVHPDSLLICIRDRYFTSTVLIAHLFGLRQANLFSVERAAEIVSKTFQRKVLSEKAPNITVNYKKIKTFHGAYTFTRKYGVPVIVKPASLSQSQLVYVCRDLEDLIKKVSFVLNHVDNVYKQNHVNRKPEVLIEQFIVGRQFSVDSYVSLTGEVVHTPICQQVLAQDLGEDNFETLYSFYPADLSSEDSKKILQSVTTAIQALDLRGVPTHVEVRLTPTGDCKIIEINVRTGGFRATMLKASYGIEHVANVIKTYLGEPPVVTDKLIQASACPQFWPDEEGILEEIEGLEEVRKLPGILALSDASKLGKYVGPASRGFGRAFYLIVTDRDRASLLQKVEFIRNTLKLRVKPVKNQIS
jgi:carbamoylphosphate synthase large subunit